MRIVRIMVTIMVIGIVVVLGISLPAHVFAIGAPQAIPTSTGVPPTRTTTRTAVINLGSYKLTQTAVALASATMARTSLATMSPIPTLTAASTTTVIPQPTTMRKPQHLPNTGNVDSSDVWYSTSILGLIGICLLVSIGLYWQSKRALK